MSERDQTLERPSVTYSSPAEISNDPALSPEEKEKALEVWEQDARQLLTASNEGMPGAEEGLDPKDHHRLGEVVRAKAAIGASPTHKHAH